MASMARVVGATPFEVGRQSLNQYVGETAFRPWIFPQLSVA
jgi:hypothetical protein